MTLKSRLTKLRIDNNNNNTSVGSSRRQTLRIDSSSSTSVSNSTRRLAIADNTDTNTDTNVYDAMKRIVQTASSSHRNSSSYPSNATPTTTTTQTTTHEHHHNNHKLPNKQKPSHNNHTTTTTKHKNRTNLNQQQQRTTTTPPMLQTMAQTRLLHDFYRLRNEPPVDILAVPTEPNNILQWDAILFGPTNSPFEGGIFKLSLTFTERYPYTAPTVRFVTKMFHPNIDPEDGSIGLDLLEENWNPVYDVMGILISIQSILYHPLIDVAPASKYYYGSEEARMLFNTNRMEYNRRVRRSLVEQQQNF